MMIQTLIAGEYIIPVPQIVFIRADEKSEYQGVKRYWLQAALCTETTTGDLAARKGITSGRAEASLRSGPTMRHLGMLEGEAACAALKAWIAGAMASGEPGVLDIAAKVAEFGGRWHTPSGTKME